MDVIKLIGKKFWAPQIVTYLWQLQNNLAMEESKLRALQDGKLRRIVKHAYSTVPFYKDLFDQHKIDPSDIHTVSDLNYLPVINKELLGDVPFDQKVSRLYLDKPLIKLYTAGSTGKSFTLYIYRKRGRRGGSPIVTEYSSCMATVFSIKRLGW
jgi:phenylacetate-coenzyme A ligase PaaK-like adenylate-forming protein